MTLDQRALQRLDALAAGNRLRRPPTIHGPQTAKVLVDQTALSSLCSNNYLGLADHPALLEAVRESLAAEGLGATASRLVNGTMASHRAFERACAELFEREDAVLFATGYAANVGALSSVLGKADVAFADELNHASLIDGLRLARVPVHVYPHRDLDRLEALLRAHRAQGTHAAVVSDSVFSMDGDEADLRGLRLLADRYDAALVVDEAHGFGVLGPQGRGLAAELGVTPDLMTLGLGKAAGVSGGVALASAAVCEWLRHDARSYVFSTAPLPLVARAARRALDLVRDADGARARLLSHARRLREGLREAGYRVPEGRTPIVPVLIGEETAALGLSQYLREQGFLVQAIRPPTVPRGTSRLRLVPTAAHEPDQLEALLQAFRGAPASARGAA